MNKHRKRAQTPKRYDRHTSANIERWKAMHGLRSSSAAEPHRDRTKHYRSDERRMRQSGRWE